MTIPIECERRFLVAGDGWRRHSSQSRRIRQGYLTNSEGVTVRVRLVGERAFLTVKTPKRGASRAEFEYEIPVDHADFLFNTACGRRTIEKVRHDVGHGGLTWTVDEFHGLNQGLVLAEIELDRADRPLALPAWVGPEVTATNRFHNSYLSRHPYSLWVLDGAA